MVRSNRFLGGVLLVAGTAIGAGMLAIPVATGFSGFFPSLSLFFFIWIFMLTTAYLFLEVNLSMKGEANMVTMAEHTLGFFGKIVSWVTYLLLLYSLTAAYLAGSAPIFREGIKLITGYKLPYFAGPLPLLIIFGLFVYLGTKAVDYVNRFLMLGLGVAFFLLIIFIPSEIDTSLLLHIDMTPFVIGIPVVITSFGFHIIIPTLTTYMRHNPKKLCLIILIGSFLPLVIYSMWQFLILGVVPVIGKTSLVQAWINGDGATVPLMHLLRNPKIAIGAQLFSFFAIVTSFLGVSLSLSDFLIDGLKIKIAKNTEKFTKKNNK